MTKHIITLSGPSLAGKTELSKLLKEKAGFIPVVSTTTRPIRVGKEIPGIDYHFLSKDEFSAQKEKGEFIQTSLVTDNFYGVHKKDVFDHDILTWAIIPSSISQVENFCKENHIKLTKVFVSNPENVLIERLLTRFKQDQSSGQKKNEEYRKRLLNIIGIEKEWIHAEKYDLIFDHFNETNQLDVLQSIQAEINKTKTKSLKF